jgi:hypothetical protein
MHVLLHADKNTDGSSAMAEHLNTVANDALGRFGDRVTRVEAHLSDVNGEARIGPADILCLLEARVIGEEPVIVQDQARNTHQAIAGAMRKLKRAVATALAKHQTGHQAGHHAEPSEPLPD